MVPARDILAFTDAIARQFHPEKIILFGSYAYGKPTEDSDVDLLVILDHKSNNIDKEVQLRGAAFFPHAMDLLVQKPAKLRRQLKNNDCILKEIVEKGLVLHDAYDIGLGEKGRRRLYRRSRAFATAKASAA
jgi:predicted nucleotidyltransferase